MNRKCPRFFDRLQKSGMFSKMATARRLHWADYFTAFKQQPRRYYWTILKCYGDDVSKLISQSNEEKFYCTMVWLFATDALTM